MFRNGLGPFEKLWFFLDFWLTQPPEVDFGVFWKFHYLLNGDRKPLKMGWEVLSQLLETLLLIPHSTIFGQYFHFHFPLSLSTFTFRRKWKWSRWSEWSWYGCPENHREGCDWIAIQDGLYLPPSSESRKIQNLEKCSSERGQNLISTSQFENSPTRNMGISPEKYSASSSQIHVN